jgi:hypothetical protein
MSNSALVYWTHSAKTYQEILNYLNASTEETPLAKIEKSL